MLSFIPFLKSPSQETHIREAACNGHLPVHQTAGAITWGQPLWLASTVKGRAPSPTYYFFYGYVGSPLMKAMLLKGLPRAPAPRCSCCPQAGGHLPLPPLGACRFLPPREHTSGTCASAVWHAEHLFMVPYKWFIGTHSLLVQVRMKDFCALWSIK